MTYYIEHRRTVERAGPLHYVPLEEAHGHTGFRSVYAFDQAARDLILRKGNVSGLESLPVYSDTLFVDFDTDEGVSELCDVLVKQGVQFKLYTTGRRGVHFHIAIEPMLGPTVPSSQLAWVEAHASGGWDRTLYRHAAIIRLPGTWHEKAPGRFKEFVESSPGSLLRVPLIEQAPKAAPVLLETSRNEAEFWSAVLVEQGEPGRTFRLYHLGALAAECGVSYEQGLEAVREWGRTMAHPPLTNEREIRRVYDNGFTKDRRLGG